MRTIKTYCKGAPFYNAFHRTYAYFHVLRCTQRRPSMAWLKSPVRLFASAAVLLFVTRLVFPPGDKGTQLQTHINFYDIRLESTGYGVFEQVAFVFVLCALTYYLISRLTNRAPNVVVGQLHFWPSLAFALFSVYMTHWANRIPDSDSSLHNWLTVFTCAYLAFLAIQLLFVIIIVGTQISGSPFRRTFRWLRGEN